MLGLIMAQMNPLPDKTTYAEVMLALFVQVLYRTSSPDDHDGLRRSTTVMKL
jgi:hypothetical protein